MYIGYFYDIYSGKHEYMFELHKRDYNKKHKEYLKSSEDYFQTLVDKRKVKSIEAICENIRHQYNRLNEVDSLESVDLMKLPLAMDEKMKKPIQDVNDYKAYPPLIKRSDMKYNTTMTFMDKLFMRRIKLHYKNMHNLYLNDSNRWLEDLEDVKKHNKIKKQDYEDSLEKYRLSIQDYEKRRKEKVVAIKAFKNKIDNKETDAIEALLSFLLDSVPLPLKDFSHNISCQIEDKTLRIEVELPYVENLLPIESVRYIKSKDELRFIEYSSGDLNRYYHELVVKYITLVSGLIGKNSQYFDFDTFVINGRIRGKTLPIKITTISTRTSRYDVFDQIKFGSIANWLDKTNGLVGKKLSNRTKLKGEY